MIFQIALGGDAVFCADDLRRHGYVVRAFDSLRVAEPYLRDCELLLAAASDLDHAALASIRRRRPGPAVVALYRPGDEEAGLLALEQGADDSFPCAGSRRELLARIKAILRGRAGGRQDRASVLALEERVRLLRRAGLDTVRLSARELELLCALARRPGEILSRAQLLDCLGGPESELYDRAVDSMVSRLRRKIIASLGRNPILTHRSAGYSLNDRARSGA